MLRSVSPSVLKAVRKLAAQKPTTVSLKDLYEFGVRSTEEEQRISNAQFLHRELQIRLAQRIVELGRLPYGLSETHNVRAVKGVFSDYFMRVSEISRPDTASSERRFTDLLHYILQDHSAVVQDMAMGVMEMRKQQGGDFDMAMAQVVDGYLNRFFMARIGLRFLIEQHVTSTQQKRPGHYGQGFSGIIQSNCSPLRVCRAAAEDARHLCLHHLGEAPEISLHGDEDTTFTYVPGHLQYVMTELLKNALRATVETHGDADALPEVQVVVARGHHDVTVKVSDQGGGIPHHEVSRCWTYLHSTAHDRVAVGGGGSAAGVMSQRGVASEVQHGMMGQFSPTGLSSIHTTGALAGYGFGLPLSRLYSQYFGGDLDIKSMEGFGTDAYCHLNALGTNCEDIPSGVAASPAERDSTLEDSFAGLG
jgi:pyruvate dehydrogenase kinase 2/3/4